MTERLVVLTPWYPTEQDPANGSFVAAAVAAVAHRLGAEVPVVHVRAVPPEPGVATTVLRTRHEHGPLVRISVPIDTSRSRLLTSRAMGAALQANLPPELAEAEVVHVHAGVPMGVALLDVVTPDQRVVLTEHASYLQRVLADAPTRKAYGESLARAAVILPVSDALSRSISGAFPRLGERVRTVPNPVDVADIPARQDHPELLDDWLVVSSLIPRKNVGRILEVFARWLKERPAARLTVIGEGPDRDALETQVSRSGLQQSVTFLGAMPHEQVLRSYQDHSLFVHLSGHETFGVVLAEAVAAGLCVVSAGGSAQREVLREANALGVAALVDLEAGDEEIVEAIHFLERPDRGRDHALAAQCTNARFSPERVAEALVAAYDGAEPTRAPGSSLRIAVLADPYSRRAPAMIRAVNHGVAVGASVILVTRRGASWRGLPDGLQVVGIGGSLRWAFRGTRLVLRAGRAPLAVLAAVPGLGRPAARALQSYDAAAEAIRHVVEGVLSNVVVPFLRGRAVGRVTDTWAEGLDLVISDGVQWSPVAWRLARLNPQAEVKSSITGRQLRQLLAARLRTT